MYIRYMYVEKLYVWLIWAKTAIRRSSGVVKVPFLLCYYILPRMCSPVLLRLLEKCNHYNYTCTKLNIITN